MNTQNNNINIFSLIFLILLSFSSFSNHSSKKIAKSKNIYNTFVQKQLININEKQKCTCENEDTIRSQITIDDFDIRAKEMFDAQYHIKKEWIDGKDYGQPGTYKNFQVLKVEFREISIKNNMLEGCPTGYRLMTLEDLRTIEKDLNKKSLYEVLIDRKSFNIQSSYKYVLNTKSYPEAKSMEDDKYYLKKTFYLDEESQTVKFIDLNPAGKKDVQFKCILDSKNYKLKIRIINSSRSDDIIDLGENLIVMINNPNVRDVIWKTDYFRKQKETLYVAYKDEGCTNIHAWGILPSEQIVYGCRAFYVKPKNDIKLSNVNSIREKPTVMTYNKNFGILKNALMPLQIPLTTNSDDQIVLFYTHLETHNLHLMVLDNKLQEVSDLDLNITAHGLDIIKTRKWYVILCREYQNDSHMYLYGMDLDFKFSWKRDIVYNLPDPTFEDSIDQNINVIFKNKKGEVAFGMNKIFKIISGKLEFAGNRIGVLFSHLNYFGKSIKRNERKYLGSTFLSFDEDGQNEKLGFSWAASPTLDISLRSDGENFITSSLSGAYPDNIVLCSVSIRKFSKEKDFYNRPYKHLVKCKSLSNEPIPVDGKGNSCGRMSKILYDNKNIFSIVTSVSSCEQVRKFYPDHENKFFITFFDKELNIKSVIDLGNFDNIKCLDSARLGKNYAIFFTTVLVDKISNQNFFDVHLKENNSKTYIMVVDPQGKIIKPAREINSSNCGNIQSLNDGSVVLPFLKNDGRFEIIKLNKYQI
jgi:hypothetical protein